MSDHEYASIPAAIPAEESQRLAALARYCIMDTPAEPLFDQLTAIGATFFKAPLCLITLMGEDRQFIKSCFGAEIREATREDSFCGYALLDDEPTVVLDALTDIRFARNCHVLGPAHVRFYAGAPLLSSDGYKIGTVCLFDFVARTEFGESERNSLKGFAELASNLVEQRVLVAEVIRSHEELRVSTERYRLATPSIRDGIWDWDVLTGKAYYSANWQLIFGLPATEHLGDISHWFDRFHPKDALRRDREGAALAAGSNSEFEGEYRVGHADGTWHWMRSRGNVVRDAGGMPIRLTGSLCDITEEKCIDVLTGIHTRECLLEHLEYRLESTRDDEKTFALINIGLHHFKHINDSFGHREGDRVLAEIARRLQETLAGHSIRNSFAPATGTSRTVAPDDQFTSLSVVARMRGAVFAILLGGVKDLEDVVTYANLLQMILSAPVESEGQSLSMSAGIGIVMCEGDCTSAERVIEDAEVAMHQAKDSGDAIPVVFDVQMRERTQRRIELESDLRGAVAEKQLLLHYQPKVVLASGEIIGFEALVRWHHPTRGMISPAEFIPHAESTGLIVEIGHWIMCEAMRQLQVWTEADMLSPRITMAVNLSTRQFQDRALLRDIKNVLQEQATVAANLTLEVTESALIGNMDLAKEKLDALRALGVRLDLDDFGTGYSSLHYLHRLPFHSLKIDQSFVRSLEESAESLAIARSIIQLGISLNMAVIAEGVETAEQRDHLVGLGCVYGQGYFFSKPLAADAMEQLLRRSRDVQC